MSVQGKKRKCPGSRGTSVLPSGADIVSLPRHVHLVPSIGIGGSLAAPPLPHHRTYGSVYGGSRSYANALRSNDSTCVGWAFPSVPMIMRHLSPKSLASGRRKRSHGYAE